MKIYVYGSTKEPFSLMSVPTRGMVNFDICGDLHGYTGIVYYLEKWQHTNLERWNMVFLGTLEA